MNGVFSPHGTCESSCKGLPNVALQQQQQLTVSNCLPTDNVHAGCRYEVTKKHPQGKTLGAALSQVFDPELTNWLLAETAENRDRQVGPHKVKDCLQSTSTSCCKDTHNKNNFVVTTTKLGIKHCFLTAMVLE